MADKLVEIERKHWPKLRDLYSPICPETYLSYSILENYVRWSKQEPESVDMVCYSLNGDWSDGTFLVLWESKNDRDMFYVNSLEESRKRLSRLLHLIDFSKGVYFKCIMENDLEAVSQVIKMKNLKIDYELNRLWYHLPRTQALSMEIAPPEQITLKSVTQSDVHTIDEVWPHRHPGSLEILQTTARLNPNVGAFNADGRLIAWALRWPQGSIAALQVKEEYMGRGLGTLIVKAITRKIAETGLDVCAGVTKGNAPSQAIFEKLGFTHVFNIYWVGTLPTDSNYI